MTQDAETVSNVFMVGWLDQNMIFTLGSLQLADVP